MNIKSDIKLGYSCNNNCLFCVVADKRGFADSSTAEAKKQLELAHENGAQGVVLTGGEVTIRRDIFEIVSHAKSLGFEIIQIQTNGRMLSSKEFCSKIISAGATEFSPALHGHVADLHDYLVQSKNAFAQTVNGIKNLKSLDAYVITNSVVTRPNHHYLPELVRLLLELNVDQFQLAFVHANGNAHSNFDHIVPSASIAAEYMKRALDIAKGSGKKMMVEAMPFCLMQGYEQYCAEKYIPFTEIREPASYTPDFGKVRVSEGKCKGESCKLCIHFDACEGPWREYPEKRGWSEFKPVLQ